MCAVFYLSCVKQVACVQIKCAFTAQQIDTSVTEAVNKYIQRLLCT